MPTIARGETFLSHSIEKSGRHAFGAKGAGSFKPGATPQRKLFLQTSAKSANQPERLPYKFFPTQAPTRSSAFSIFSIELATLKRK